jgi:uncharacterized protein YaiI (UPF0178 family)
MNGSGAPAPAPRKVIVDPDACPFKEDILELAARAGARVVLVASANHQMPEAEGAEVVVVDHRARDAADFEAFNRSRPGDILITQDAGLAAMVLPRGVIALSPRGRLYTEESLDARLTERHAIARLKRRGRVPPRRRPPRSRRIRPPAPPPRPLPRPCARPPNGGGA